MNIRKILLVILFVLAILGLGFALYWVFFRTAPVVTTNDNFVPGNIPNVPNSNITVVNTNVNINTSLPWQQYVGGKVSNIANGGLTEVTKVVDSKVTGFTKGNQGVQFYDADKQQFFRINDQGQLVALNDKKFYKVEKVTWNNNGEKAIIEYPDGNNILYNFRTNEQVTLPIELVEFSLNNQGSQISAKWLGDTEDNNWLISANDDGSQLALLEPLGDKSYSTQMVFSPDNQVAALHTKYIDAQRQEVFPIGFNGENLKSFEVAGGGFVADWSPQGNTMVYSVYNEATNYNPNLWITKGRTSELGDIKVSLNVPTWPDKCTFADESTMYCAVPQGLPRGAGIYPEISYQYPDNFYRIDLNSGLKTLLASPVGADGIYSATNLFTSADGSILYFIDNNTGRLQTMRLR